MNKNFTLKLTRNGRIWRRKTQNKHGEEVYDVVVNGKSFHRGVCVRWFYILTGIRIKPTESMYFTCYGKDDTALFRESGLHWSEHYNNGDR